MAARLSRRLSRRRFLRTTGAGAALLCAASAARAQARKRMTREEAEYEDEARDGLVCSGCALFQDPKYCVILDGEISPNGTCKYYVHVE